MRISGLLTCLLLCYGQVAGVVAWSIREGLRFCAVSFGTY